MGIDSAVEVYPMTAPSTCPTADTLRLLLNGASPPSDQPALIAHLDHCDDCRRTLDDLAGMSPALLSAVNSLQRTLQAREAPLQRLLANLEQDATLSVLHSPPRSTGWVQSLLEPADAPEALGRLEEYLVTE